MCKRVHTCKCVCIRVRVSVCISVCVRLGLYRFCLRFFWKNPDLSLENPRGRFFWLDNLKKISTVTRFFFEIFVWKSRYKPSLKKSNFLVDELAKKWISSELFCVAPEAQFLPRLIKKKRRKFFVFVIINFLLSVVWDDNITLVSGYLFRIIEIMFVQSPQ